jgi:hypothetical protein
MNQETKQYEEFGVDFFLSTNEQINEHGTQNAALYFHWDWHCSPCWFGSVFSKSEIQIPK